MKYLISVPAALSANYLMQVIHMKNICYFNTNQFCFQFMKEAPVRIINSPA